MDIWMGAPCGSLGKKRSVKCSFRNDCIVQKLIKEQGFGRFRIQRVEDYPYEELYQRRPNAFSWRIFRELLENCGMQFSYQRIAAVKKYADERDYYEKK